MIRRGRELDAELSLARGRVATDRLVLVRELPGADPFPRRHPRGFLGAPLGFRDLNLGGFELRRERVDAFGETTVFKNGRTDLLAFAMKRIALELHLRNLGLHRGARSIVDRFYPLCECAGESAIGKPSNRPVEDIRATPLLRLRRLSLRASRVHVLGPSREGSSDGAAGEPRDDGIEQPLFFLLFVTLGLAGAVPRLPRGGDPAVRKLRGDPAKHAAQALSFIDGIGPGGKGGRRGSVLHLSNGSRQRVMHRSLFLDHLKPRFPRASHRAVRELGRDAMHQRLEPLGLIDRILPRGKRRRRRAVRESRQRPRQTRSHFAPFVDGGMPLVECPGTDAALEPRQHLTDPPLELLTLANGVAPRVERGADDAATHPVHDSAQNSVPFRVFC